MTGEKIGTVRARERSLRNTLADLKETLERYQNQVATANATIRGLKALVDQLQADLRVVTVHAREQEHIAQAAANRKG